MAEEVKPQPRRRYDTTRRQAQAAQTRQDIVAAAQRVFLERGYSGATLTAIAQAAGVVVETIYRGFGSKASLFKVVVRAAVAGGAARAAVPPEQRPAIQAVIAETDPRRQFQLYAATQPGIHARAGPLLRVLVWAPLENERLAGMGRFAQRLADRGVLRPGLSAEDARDVLWTLNSMAVHDLLVVSAAGRPSATATGLPTRWPRRCCPTSNRAGRPPSGGGRNPGGRAALPPLPARPGWRSGRARQGRGLAPGARVSSPCLGRRRRTWFQAQGWRRGSAGRSRGCR